MNPICSVSKIVESMFSLILFFTYVSQELKKHAISKKKIGKLKMKIITKNETQKENSF